MPEYPEYQAFAHHFRVFMREYQVNHGARPKGYVQLIPRAFALGSDEHPYTTCTVDTSAYSGATDFPTDIEIHEHDVRRAAGQPYAYLLRPQPPDDVLVAVRGKQIAFALGRDCFTIHLGLEGHIHSVTLEEWKQIYAGDVEGTNEEPGRAQLMRQFRIPPEFIKAGTSKVTDRRVTVHMALYFGNRVWLLIDFSRLARIHVTSVDTPWSQTDMVPGGPRYEEIWQYFGDGPDINLEPVRFMANLDKFHNRILSGLEYEDASTPIVSWLCKRGDICNGIGRHTASDLVHFWGLAPSMPTSLVFRYHYDVVKSLFPAYMAYWVSDKYLKDCCGAANSLTVFAWNSTSCHKYRQRCLLVFRKAETTVNVSIFNRHARNGNLDPDHVLGKPYDVERAKQFISSNRERVLNVPVHHMLDKGKHIDAYTIVVAKSPTSWFDGTMRMAKDVIEFGRASKIGPSEFNALNQNMPDLKAAIEQRRRGGRPRKERTGQRGRPSVAPKIAELRKALKPIPARILEARQAQSAAEKAEKQAMDDAAAAQPIQDFITSYYPIAEPDSGLEVRRSDGDHVAQSPSSTSKSAENEESLPEIKAVKDSSKAIEGGSKLKDKVKKISLNERLTKQLYSSSDNLKDPRKRPFVEEVFGGIWGGYRGLAKRGRLSIL
ncbi:uncharacterized protein B0H18DRAFT_651148 [Fomitopsis serialis]|uniref:uncharacterized protein n=1 Tax=Fomitopsis serialis TaxID=139415 RepID=UPI0020088AE9|nr:uncharacterized protein B0H18DRAFT_651148 [Neoantrodia serialis]KAH9919241.1 hypothetical protein B0H18DRAFT_651148 [Neoantrodia serialis]